MTGRVTRLIRRTTGHVEHRPPATSRNPKTLLYYLLKNPRKEYTKKHNPYVTLEEEEYVRGS